jgi:hypothetical protein
LYLARGNGGERKCASIKHIQALVTEEGMEFVDAANTQKAAEMAASGEYYWCVTNQHGLDKHRLTVVRQLKEMLMDWMPFVYNHDYKTEKL